MKAKKTKRSDKQVSFRIAVPADIYISIELPSTTSKARAFAIAAARLDEACAGEPFMNLKRDFSESEHVLVYLGRDSAGRVRLSDCTLEDVEDRAESA